VYAKSRVFKFRKEVSKNSPSQRTRLQVWRIENSLSLNHHQNLSKNLISAPLANEIIYSSSQNVIYGTQNLSYSNTATSTHHTFVDLDILKADEESKKGSKRMKERRI
jgi:hypothetical protein